MKVLFCLIWSWSGCRFCLRGGGPAISTAWQRGWVCRFLAEGPRRARAVTKGSLRSRGGEAVEVDFFFEHFVGDVLFGVRAEASRKFF